MKKSTLLMIVSVVLALTLSLGSTLAYLQDSDSDVNVMTLGSVYIEQHEYEREVNADGSYETKTIDDQTSYVLKEFTQGKPLMPATESTNFGAGGWDEITVRMKQVGSYGGMQVFTSKNAQDKFVTVENTGKSDAYVRTIVAIEVGSTDGSLIGHSYHQVWTPTDFNESTTDKEPLYVSIDGNQYMVYEFNYSGAKLSDGSYRHANGVLPAGDTTYPSLSQVYLKSEAGNEDMEAIDGNKNGMLDILVLSQAVQVAGFANAKTALDTAFGAVNEKNVKDWLSKEDTLPMVNVTTAAELQAALEEAVDGTYIILADDITGDVTVTQKPNVKLTIDGANNTFAGVILVDGKSATYTTAGLTIKNVNFKADSISADACIRLGNGEPTTRYTCNVTVDNCIFDVPGVVGVKSYTGGDKNLTIINSTATANAHSLVQAKGIDGVLVKNCEVYSESGMNFNNSDKVTVDGCTVDVQGYAVRFGESSGGASAAETYLIKNSTLKSACNGGDAVIVLRGTADYATLTIENTTLVGTPQITNTATGATVVTK